MARPLNNSGKLGKNVQSLSFLKSRLIPKFGEKISSHCSPKKFLNFTVQAVNIRDMAKKIKKNITGLRNQSKSTSHVEEAPIDRDSTKTLIHPVTRIHSEIKEQSDNDEGWDAHIRLDSNKTCWELDSEENDSEDEGGIEDEVIEAGEDEWRSEGLHVALMVLAIDIGDDPRDEDWIPDSLRRKHNARMARGKIYLFNGSEKG